MPANGASAAGREVRLTRAPLGGYSAAKDAKEGSRVPLPNQPGTVGEPLPATTAMGRVRLRVADLDRSLAFYRDLLGFTVWERHDRRALLVADPNAPAPAPLIILEAQPGARPQPPGTAGLYHFATLVPDRRRLALLLRRLAEAGWPLQGLSDHGVSEAIYLADPDGNGLELYADRPREQWPMQNGRLAMVTRPLDVRNLLAELAKAPLRSDGPVLDPATRIGHVHLRVSSLERAETFYHGLIGFEVTQRNYPGALFLAAGGYHHHLGVNVWSSAGGPPAPPDCCGLLDFAILLPDDAARAVRARLEEAGVDLEPCDEGWRARDGDGIGVVITVGAVGA